MLLQVCGNQTGYTPPASRLCNTFVCKSNSDCSNAGTCNTAAGTCTCQAGFAGESQDHVVSWHP